MSLSEREPLTRLSLIAGFALTVFLHASPLYAADCSTSFDQHCLSEGAPHVTAEQSPQSSTERRDRIAACKEAVIERRRTLLVQNQLDTELALNDLVNRKLGGEFNPPPWMTRQEAYLPPGMQRSVRDSFRESAMQAEESRIRERGLWNQKMIEAKGAEALDACLVEE